MERKNKSLAVPFLPGDDLYYVVTGNQVDSGPGVFEIKYQKNGIGAIQIDTEGNARIVDGDSGTAELPVGPWNCLDEKSAMDWAKENMPGAVHLDGRSVTAIYSGPDGSRKAVAFGSTMSELEELVCAKPNTMMPDELGIMAVYDANARKETSPYSTFLNDSTGRPVDVIYGPYLLIAIKENAGTGFYEPVDVPQEMLDAMDRKPPENGAVGYDPAYWTRCDRMTVGMLKAFLSKLPDGAVLHCCGTDQAYLHYCVETGALSVDSESLEDLPEYEGREPAVLKGAER